MFNKSLITIITIMFLSQDGDNQTPIDSPIHQGGDNSLNKDGETLHLHKIWDGAIQIQGGDNPKCHLLLNSRVLIALIIF